MTVSGVLGSLEAGAATRHIDVLEVWSGCFVVGRAAAARGYVSMPFDNFREPGGTDVDGELRENLLCRSGFDAVESAC